MVDLVKLSVKWTDHILIDKFKGRVCECSRQVFGPACQKIVESNDSMPLLQQPIT